MATCFLLTIEFIIEVTEKYNDGNAVLHMGFQMAFDKIHAKAG